MQEKINKMLRDKVELLEVQVKELQEKVNKSDEDVNPVVVSKTENTTWPMQGDDYWYICGDGELGEDIWAGANTADKLYLEIGNCFKTRKEAELAVQKLKALKRLRDKGFKFDNWKSVDVEDNTIFIQIEARVNSFSHAEDLNLLFDGEY